MRIVIRVLLLIILLAVPCLAAEQPDAKLQERDSIAVFDLEVAGTVDKNVSRPLSDSVRRELFQSGKYDVIDRSDMDRLLKEHAIQLNECTQKDCAVKAGKLLGVSKVIVGTVGMVGNTYYISLSLVNVGTGKIEMIEDDACKCEIDELLRSSKRVAGKVMGKKPSEAGFSQAKPLPGEFGSSRPDEAGETGKRSTLVVEDQVKGFYAGIRYNFTNAKPPEEIDSGVRMQPTSVDRGSGLGANVGYNFNKYLALEGGIAGSSFKIKEATLTNRSSPTIKYVPDNPEMTLTVITLDVKVSYPVDRFMPYVQLGYGQYRYKADFRSQANGLPVIGWSSNTNEARIGGGASVRINASLFFDLRYVTSPVANMTEVGLTYRF
jgi:opacity protein-like surface antigen